MLGLVLVEMAVSHLSPVGRVFAGANTGAKVLGNFLRDESLLSMERCEEMGVNWLEEEHHRKLYGAYVPMFPFLIDSGQPVEEQKKVFGVEIDGRFVLKLSEWADVTAWLARKAQGLPEAGDARDGSWLLVVGRKRWDDKRWCTAAFENVKGNPAALAATPGMLEKIPS